MALPENIVDPGMVNIEDQAYPRPLDPDQALIRQLNELIAGDAYAPPIVRNLGQAIPDSLNVNVLEQAFLNPSLSRGEAVPFFSNVNIGSQGLNRGDVRDFTVTESGNFQTSVEYSAVALTVVSLTDADTGGATSSTTTRYRVVVSGLDLTAIGFSIAGREVVFKGNVTAGIIDYVRTIAAFNANSIVIPVTQNGRSFNPDPGAPPVTPQAGDQMELDLNRNGSEVIYDQVLPEISVNLWAQAPLGVVPTVAAEIVSFSGNFLAGNGVVEPFVGSGVQVPRLVGTFEVANQVVIGNGLPANVFQ